jgi:uncharacterized protein (TIGR04255 family)
LPNETALLHTIPAGDLAEIFPRPAVKEVAFEVRFAPRFRIKEQMWRYQDIIANDYPVVSHENMLQSDGRVVVAYVFTNPTVGSVIKISESNFAVAVTKYATYENFKAEALARTNAFCRTFELRGFSRVGLRYINHIELAATEPFSLLERYVNVPLRFDRFDKSTITQLLSEFCMRFEAHQMTVRGALLQVPSPVNTYVYVLDLDCYSEGNAEGYTEHSLEAKSDAFHNAIQVQFLQHVTDEYKRVMRGKP